MTKLPRVESLDPLRLDQVTFREVDRIKSNILLAEVDLKSLLCNFCMVWMLIGKQSAVDICRCSSGRGRVGSAAGCGRRGRRGVTTRVVVDGR